MLAASVPCGAGCIEVVLSTASQGCCVAHKRQLDRPLLMVVLRGAVIQNSRFLGVLRRRAGRGERRGGGGGVARWCGGVGGRWRRCRRWQRAHRDSRCDFGVVGRCPWAPCLRSGAHVAAPAWASCARAYDAGVAVGGRRVRSCRGDRHAENCSRRPRPRRRRRPCVRSAPSHSRSWRRGLLCANALDAVGAADRREWPRALCVVLLSV